MTEELICPLHGPFVPPHGASALFRDGEGFDVACPVLDEEGNPHFVPAQLVGGEVVERAA